MRLAETNFYRAFSRQRCRFIASSLTKLLDENISVLDFGCGNMFVSKELTALRNDISITGIDIIRDINLNGMGKNPNLKFVLTKTGKIPFDDNSFDSAVASASLHHTDNPEFYLGELKRVIKSGGSIVLIEEMYHHLLDKWYVSVSDYLLNSMKKDVPIPLEYRSYHYYKKLFDKMNLQVEHESGIRPGFPYMHHYVFKLQKV